MTFSDLFIFGLCAHIVADWFLQNEWMSKNKPSLLHPASWVHSLIHFLCFLPVFGWLGALGVFLTHILIDTREPLKWWRLVYRQSTPEQAGEAFIPFAMWQDQMAHVLVIAAIAYVWTV